MPHRQLRASRHQPPPQHQPLLPPRDQPPPRDHPQPPPFSLRLRVRHHLYCPSHRLYAEARLVSLRECLISWWTLTAAILGVLARLLSVLQQSD